MGQMGMMMPLPRDEQLLELAFRNAQQALTGDGRHTLLAFKEHWLTAHRRHRSPSPFGEDPQRAQPSFTAT